jgi:hypothetical protein
MGRRLVSVKGRIDGGPVAGGSGYELKIYDDEALAVPSTLYARSAGAVNQPNPMKPNAGMQSALLADRVAGDAFVTVNDVTGFQVGDLVPIYDGANTVYKVITIITPATRRLDLDQTLGFNFTVANGTLIGNEDMTGHMWFYVDDATDKFAQPKEVASGRLLPPLLFPVRVPTSAVEVAEEGTLVGTRPRINFIGGTITAVDNAGANRVDVTVAAAPDNASFVTTASEAGLSNEKVLGTTVIMAGTNAGRPAASLSGLLYVTTDSPITIQRDNGASWLAAGFQNPMTTAEDLIKGGASGAQARLAVGSNDFILSVIAGVVGWRYPVLASASAALGSDLTTFTNGTWQDGPSISCAAGTWILIGHAQLHVGGQNFMCARMGDGTTHVASGQYGGQTSTSTGESNVAFVAIVTPGSTTTYKLQFTGSTGGGGVVRAAIVDNGSGNNATRIAGLRIA